MNFDWDGFRYFLAIHKCRTLKGAARELKVDQATVGRRLTALETEVGTTLFEKRSDGYFLTLAGERILETVQSIEDGFHSVQRSITGKDERPEGVVRIAMPGALANHWLIPRLKQFCLSYPQIELHFLTGSEVVNLSRREADLAIRLVRPTRQELIAKRVGSLSLSLYGSRSLFSHSNTPRSIEDLNSFGFIGLYESAQSASEREIIKELHPWLRPSFRSAAWSSVYSAVSAGLGIGILPTFFEQNSDDLVELPFVTSRSSPLWLVAHKDISRSARIRAVSQYLASLYD